MFDVEKVIVNISLPTAKFWWVSKTRLRTDLGFHQNDQFVDAILLSGCSFCRPFPPLENSVRQFDDAVALIKRYKTVGNAIATMPDHAPYLEKFKKARAAIKHHVVLHVDGKVEPMNPEDSPNDVHEFIGQRLPEELYFYLSRGLIGPQVLDMITSFQYVQVAPLDNNESEEYKKFLTHLNSLRVESLALLTKNMHGYWKTREVKVYCWFDPANPKSTLIPKEIQPPSDSVQDWNVRESIWGPEMDKQKVCPIANIPNAKI